MAKKGKGKTSGAVVQGTIESELIRQAHHDVKAIVDRYASVNLEVSNLTNQIKDDWVGEGRKEFEVQYNMLINKIKDFGDTLQEIYEALVEAEYNYQDVDDSIRQEFVMAMQGDDTPVKKAGKKIQDGASAISNQVNETANGNT